MCSAAITTQEVEKGFNVYADGDFGPELADLYLQETVAAINGSDLIRKHVEIATRTKGAVSTFAAGILVGKEIEAARRNAYQTVDSK